MVKTRKPEHTRSAIEPVRAARPGFGGFAKDVVQPWKQHGPSVPKTKTRPASKGRVHQGRTRS